MIENRNRKLSKLLQWLLTGERNENDMYITDHENGEFRKLMRDQLKQLKDKGLPLRIMTL